MLYSENEFRFSSVSSLRKYLEYLLETYNITFEYDDPNQATFVNKVGAAVLTAHRARVSISKEKNKAYVHTESGFRISYQRNNIFEFFYYMEIRKFLRQLRKINNQKKLNEKEREVLI